MANTDRNISIIAGTGGSGDCGCCKITELCYDTDNIDYTTFANLKLEVIAINEGLNEDFENRTIINIVVSKIGTPQNIIGDTIQLEEINVLGNIFTGQYTGGELASLLGGTKQKTIVGTNPTYVIKPKKLGTALYELEFVGITADKLFPQGVLESNRYTILYKNIDLNSPEWGVNRLVLYSNHILDYAETANGFKLKYSTNRTTSNALARHWFKETADKIENASPNPFFKGNKATFVSRVWNSLVLNVPQSLLFTREITGINGKNVIVEKQIVIDDMNIDYWLPVGAFETARTSWRGKAHSITTRTIQ